MSQHESLEQRLGRLRAAVEDRQQVQERGFADWMNEFNTGVARFLGIFIDPFAGPGETQQLMARLGMAHPPGEEGQGFAARFLQELGSMAIPLGGQAALGARLMARPMAAAAATPFEQASIQLAQRPLAEGAKQAGIAASAVVGGMVAEDIGSGEPWQRAIGELVGGLAPGAIAGAVRAGAGRIMADAAGISRPAKRAASRIQKLAEKQADEMLDELQANPLNLPPMEAVGDPGVASLQRAAAAVDPKLAGRLVEQERQAVEKARELLLRTGDPKAVKVYLNNLVRAAVAEVQRSIEKLEPKLTMREANLITQQRLLAAYNKARAVEDKLWNKIPNVEINPTRVISTFAELLLERTPESPATIPRYLYRFLGNYDEETGEFVFGALKPFSKNLVELRKRIVEDMAREAASKTGSPSKIRVLAKLNDAILETLEQSQVGDRARAAIEFSRDLNQRFTKGFVGELLRFPRTDDADFLPLDTLDRLQRMTGERGAAAVRQLLAAEPKLRGAVADVVKQGFLNQVLDVDGKLVVRNAKRFLQRNKQLLEQFPEIKTAIEDSIKAQKVSDFLIGARKPVPTSPLRKRMSVASLWLDAPVGSEIKRIVEASPNPRAAMRDLLRLVSGNKEAMAGVRAAIMDYVWNKSKAGLPDPQGFQMISGRRMLQVMKENEGAFKVFLAPSHVNRLKLVARELSKIEQARAAAPAAGGLLSDKPGTLLEFVTRTLAVRMFAKIGQGTTGASLLTAAFGSKKAKELAMRLTNDKAKDLLFQAVEDPDMMRALLLPLSKASPFQRRAAFNRVMAWLAIPATTVFPGKAEPEQNPMQQRLEKLRQDLMEGIVPSAGTGEVFSGYPEERPYVDILQEVHGGPAKGRAPFQVVASLAPVFEAAEKRYGLPRGLLARIAKAESDFKESVISGRERSPKGAVGVMQLMPVTVKDLRQRFKLSVNPRDPASAVEAAAAYLGWLLQQFDGDIVKAVAAYNAGPTRVRRSGLQALPAETKRYIKKVLGVSLGPQGSDSKSPPPRA